MPDRHPLFDAPPRPGVVCPSCGGLFEAPVVITGEDGQPKTLPGHQRGDPKTCIRGGSPKLVLDARERKRMRERM